MAFTPALSRTLLFCCCCSSTEVDRQKLCYTHQSRRSQSEASSRTWMPLPLLETAPCCPSNALTVFTTHRWCAAAAVSSEKLSLTPQRRADHQRRAANNKQSLTLCLQFRRRSGSVVNTAESPSKLRRYCSVACGRWWSVFVSIPCALCKRSCSSFLCAGCLRRR